MNPQTNISQRIRELRERTGLTQEKFVVRLCVTSPTINRWKNGRTRPSPPAMQKIEELLRSKGDRGSYFLVEIYGNEPL